jgi:type III secretion protein T
MIFEISHEVELHLLSLVASYPRMLAFLSTAMLFSQSAMPRTVRNGLVILLCLPVVPANHAGLEAGGIEPWPYFMLLAKEFFIGFCLGYAVGWIFWATQAAGALIDNQRGAAIAESIDPLQGHQTSPLGNLFSQAITTYLFTTGAILLLIQIIYESFRLWPVWSFFPVFTPEFPRLFFSILDGGMRLAFVLAAPIVLVMFVAEAALAFVGRFAPQVQVFILAMPIKSGLATFMLIFYVALLFPDVASRYDDAQRFAFRLFSIASPAGTDPGTRPDGDVP